MFKQIPGTFATLIGVVLPASGQIDTSPPDFFEDRDVLEFVIVTDLSLLLEDRAQDNPDRSAEVGYFTADGTPVWIPVGIRTRGKFRLDKANCSFPPLRLDFPARRLRNTIFDGQNRVKMVTHCQNQPAYQQHLILEYLAYRSYELLTPLSFRTRLAKVTYIDASESTERTTRYAFLIEDVDDVALRNGLVQVHPEGFHGLLADPVQLGIHDVFQYMIGNTDWSLFLNQNVEFMTDSEGQVAVVPFDFDWSGLVSAPYAKPAPDVPVQNVRERFYMGVCRQEDHLTTIFQLYKQLRPQMLALYENVPALSDATRASALTYLNEFYETLNDDTLAKARIRDACRV